MTIFMVDSHHHAINLYMLNKHHPGYLQDTQLFLAAKNINVSVYWFVFLLLL